MSADKLLDILEAEMSRISGVDMRRNRIIMGTSAGESSWYAEEMLRHMAQNRRHMWRARVAHAIEEADTTINEVLMRGVVDPPRYGTGAPTPEYVAARRPWPRRRGNQAVSHDWLETVLIALVLALLLLAAVAFVAPAMLPAR